MSMLNDDVTSEAPPVRRRSIVPKSTTARAVLGSVVAFAALVTDVLLPLAPIALWLAIAPALLLLAVWLAMRFWPWADGLGKRMLGDRWGKPALLILGAAGLLLVLADVSTRFAPAGGWLGSRVSAVRDVQNRLGGVDAQIEETANTTRDIEKDTQQILTELDKVKKETSDDPRKELANLGVAWSTQSFVEALKAGDARVVELFLAGGMSPAVQHNGASAVLYMLQPTMPDPVPMLKLMIAAGFDVDADLVDSLIMRDYGDYMPPYFESPDLPAAYGGGRFGGPALLWLAIRSAYGGPFEETWDVGVIEFLKSQGADTRLTRQFLTALEYAWGDTPSYQRVRGAVY